MPKNHRRLPHLYPENTPLFITWHLPGSLPETLYPPPGKPNAGKAFVWMDRYLDTKRTGPRYLQNPAIATLVAEAIQRGDTPLGHYKLHAYAVMPNHVHLLVTPKIAPSRLLQSLKGFTAREANKLLMRSGPFWQHESYDHYARNAEQFHRIKAYIEQNPVKAGLCNQPEQYKWSSASSASSQLAASSQSSTQTPGPNTTQTPSPNSTQTPSPTSTQTKPKPPARAKSPAPEPTQNQPSQGSALQAKSSRHNH
jgi:putative DNA methylase